MEARATYEQGREQRSREVAGFEDRARAIGTARLVLAVLALVLVGGLVWGRLGSWAGWAVAADVVAFVALVVVHARVHDARERASAALRFSNIPARPSAEDTHSREGLVVVTLYYTKTDNPGAFGTQFDRSLRRLAEAHGARTLAAYVSSSQENNYPKLPVRTGEHLFVWVATFANADAYADYEAKLMADKKWTASWNSAREQLTRDPEVLRLTPTARSRLRG